LDHIHKAYVAAYPKDAKLFVATDDNAMLELVKKEWPAGEWAPSVATVGSIVLRAN
jgi:hypothetical protein